MEAMSPRIEAKLAVSKRDAVAPDSIARLVDREPQAVLPREVAHGQACWARAEDRNVRWSAHLGGPYVTPAMAARLTGVAEQATLSDRSMDDQPPRRSARIGSPAQHQAIIPLEPCPIKRPGVIAPHECHVTPAPTPAGALWSVRG